MIRNIQDPWKLEEPFFTKGSSKYESLFTLGNGYMGIRGVHEEDYLQTTRGFFISGLYNKFDNNEVCELANISDVTAIEIRLNNEKFTLSEGKILYYRRYLNLKNGELNKEVIWESEVGEKFTLLFNRFVSVDNLHLICSKVTITPLTSPCEVEIKSGINGRVTNSGAQHFNEIEKRVYENKYMQFIQRTTQSNIDVIISCAIKSNIEAKQQFTGDRRRLYSEQKVKADINESMVITKYSYITTSLDKDFLKEMDLVRLKEFELESYDELLLQSQIKWDKLTNATSILIESENNFDQLAVNYMQYQLMTMVPMHDNRFSIGAKGLSGEGYKGHIFWDTEIFLLPFYLYTNPSIAKSLLEYRYINLQAAKDKATENGYEGALFPWESAFSGREETPEYAAMNIKTGTRELIHSAMKEHHIVSDIAYAYIEYYKATDDKVFMEEKGLTLLYECAKFWLSRATEQNGRYVILDVIGPDEYTEHIDNNAYTNYMAWYTVKKTIEIGRQFNKDFDYDSLQRFADNIYLPKINENGLLPQDDTFLSKPVIELSKYRNDSFKQTILKDYTRHEIVNMQILKQADVIMLLYLLNELFQELDFSANWNYYEEKTIHDSSLSMSIHSIVSTYFHHIEKAYDCFENAIRIDLGENLNSSDEGIHAAALGAIYLCIIHGFAGINTRNDILEINPQLPKQWNSLSFNFLYKKCLLNFNISHKTTTVQNNSTYDIEIVCKNNKHTITAGGFCKLI